MPWQPERRRYVDGSSWRQTIHAASAHRRSQVGDETNLSASFGGEMGFGGGLGPIFSVESVRCARQGEGRAGAVIPGST
jgi:hypothetical protein